MTMTTTHVGHMGYNYFDKMVDEVGGKSLPWVWVGRMMGLGE